MWRCVPLIHPHHHRALKPLRATNIPAERANAESLNVHSEMRAHMQSTATWTTSVLTPIAVRHCLTLDK